MKVFAVLKNFFHFFGRGPFRGGQKNEKNSWETAKIFHENVSLNPFTDFFIDKVLEILGSTILVKFRPAHYLFQSTAFK